MKKLIILIAIGIISPSILLSQDEFDALRFSQTFPGGTARNISMGGSFGALGGDMGGLTINPAGAGVYRKSEFSFSTGLDRSFIESNFLNTQRENFGYDFNLSNIGLMGVYNSGDETGWINAGFGLIYNQNNSYLMPVTIEGTDTNSMADWFLDYASGPPKDLDDYYEGLAYDAYIIEYDTLTGGYYSTIPITNINKYNSIDISGKSSEWQFVFGSNYSNIFYFGASFSIHSLVYECINNHQETLASDISSSFEHFTFTRRYKTTGNGYSFKLGAILKPFQPLRLGFALHTPVFYSLRDKNITSITSNYINEVYDALPGWRTYNSELMTPMKIIGSIGLQIGKTALINLDVENINWQRMKLSKGSDGYGFKIENEAISNIYRPTTNYRVGGEYRLGPLSFRGGYNSYASPYKTSELNSAADYTAFSYGIGFRQNNYFVDFGAYQLIHDEKYIIYPHENVQPTNLDISFNKFIATIGFKF